VRIPKLYNGKNRTFFWLAWEGYQDTHSNTSQFTTPTALERIGDFSQSKTASGALNAIYDPQSTVCAGGTCTRQPFARGGLSCAWGEWDKALPCPSERSSDFLSAYATTGVRAALGCTRRSLMPPKKGPGQDMPGPGERIMQTKSTTG
jgi:hypothetical protein